MSMLMKLPNSLPGKIAMQFLWLVIAVFVMFLLAKIVGAPGELFFILCYNLLMVEIFALPVVTIITFSFFANILMPNLILPVIEFVFDFIIAVLNFITFRLIEDFLTNPFRNARYYWSDLDPEPLVTMLLNAIESFRITLLDL